MTCPDDFGDDSSSTLRVPFSLSVVQAMYIR
jgi:hypothetical protein